MNRISLACFVAAAVTVSGASAQNAAAPTGSGAAPQQTATQSPNTASQQPRSSESVKRAETRADTYQSPSPQQSKTETRPDANYPHPSGQDSHPDHAPRDTKIAAGSKAGAQAGLDNSPHKTGRSPQVDRLAKKKQYTGAAGVKSNPGTACSTARPTPDGGVDCGTGGNSATPNGRTITKPN